MYKKNIKVDKSPNSGHPKTLCRFLHLSSYPEFSPILVSLALIPPPPEHRFPIGCFGEKKGGIAEDYFVRLPYGINIFPRVFGIMGAGLRYFIPFDAGDQDEQVIKIFFVLFMGERVWFFTCELSARFKAFKGEQKL